MVELTECTQKTCALFILLCSNCAYLLNHFLIFCLGSSVPSGFVLWIMRDMPHRPAVERPIESRVITLFRERPSTTQDPQWTAVTSSNKVLQILHFQFLLNDRAKHASQRPVTLQS
jgi:hypothetical protein